MLRKIIKIDEAKCNGCGLCAEACHEGAIRMVDGVAKLTREDYCDGLGNCLPVCPTGAITFEEREAPAFNQDAVDESQGKKQLQWPIQIKLVPTSAPYYDGADLLIAADCAAYTYADFRNTFMQDKIRLIACPKLDSIDYSEKLTEIFSNNNIKSVTVVRMEVPCCGGLEYAVVNAVNASGKNIPVRVATIQVDGEIMEV
jgi:ferredoxin